MTSRGAILPGAWSHITISVDTSLISLFLNGLLDQKKMVQGQISLGEGDFKLGLSNTRSGVECYLDDLKIFDRVLTKIQIEENFGGNFVPFTNKKVRLACIDCPYNEA